MVKMAVLVDGVVSFYDSKGAVKDHSVESFQKQVLDGNRMWMMEFYAPVNRMYIP